MTHAASSNSRTRWDVIAVLGGTLLVAVTWVPYYGIYHQYEPALWPWFVLLVLWNGLSITAGYHRLWSHKSYESHGLVRLVFALGGALSLQNSIKEWCSNHRKHHQHVDDIELDPYSAQRGFLFSHVGWMLKDYPATSINYRNVADLDNDPIVRWQFRHYWTLAIALNVGLPLLIGLAIGDPLGAFLLLGVLRLVLCHHATFLINSLAHAWGRQPYSDDNSARDNPVVALLTYGEGYHNFHHTFQWDYRNGIRWYQFDPTKWLIATLAWCNLAWALKEVPPEQIEKRLVAMQLKTTMERIRQHQPSNRQQWLDLLDVEYAKLIETLNEWSSCRQAWLQIRRATLQQKWVQTGPARNAMLSQLRSLEERLAFQRRQWRLLTRQFA
jgi:stearoyl-CoA desaturase (Delta-9 desaturase)